jgi:putative hydrolase of the HAD superfamily
MKTEWISKIEKFLEGNDFGKNWDGAYQDAVPAIRRFFHREGFHTHIMSEWDSPSRHTELVAVKASTTVRIPWGRRRERPLASRPQRHGSRLTAVLSRPRAVLFDAAETLFTTRGSVGEIYASIARRFGSQAPSEAIQAAFVRHFRGSGPISIADQKQWWKEIVYRVFSEVGMVEDFDEFFDRVYDQFRDSQGWMLFPETFEVLQQLRTLGVRLGIISNFDTRIYSVLESLGIRDFFEADHDIERNRLLQAPPSNLCGRDP